MDLRTNLKHTKKNLAEYGKYRLQNNQLMVKTLVELKGNFVGSIGGNQHLDKNYHVKSLVTFLMQQFIHDNNYRLFRNSMCLTHVNPKMNTE